jgi:MFS transporter, DHA3 family, macrolide efflux protein
VTKFAIVWAGQLISLLGSGISAFALGVWAYRATGSVTQFALVLFFAAVPGVLLLPVAGLLADRWDRRRTMILSDTGAAVGTAALALLFFFDRIEMRWVYIILTFSSSMGTFQRPAYSAAVTQLVAKEHFARANGQVRAAQAVSQILAPLLAGALLGPIGIEGILIIDLVSFGFAFLSLLAVRFPPLAEGEETKAASSWAERWQELTAGWTYLVERGGLMALMILLAGINFSFGLASALVQPLVLSFGSPTDLGTALTIGGAGLLVGSVVMGAWGGPKRRVNGIFGFVPLAAIGVFLVGLKPSIPWITAAMALVFFCLPFIEGSTTAIVQSKVAPRVQGRVFAITHMIAGSMAPISYLLAGPLVDQIFSPLLKAGGPLASSLGLIFGVGEGRGIALLMSVLGIALLVTTFIAFLLPRIRHVEDDLPDMVPDTPTAPREATQDPL